MQAHRALLAATFLVASLVGCSSPQPAGQAKPVETVDDEPPASVAANLGRVALQTSCNEAAQSHLEVGTAQLHHMWYEKARASFQEAAAADADCAMAHWGVAMTYYTPLWAKPTAQELDAGARAAERAAEIGGETPREQAYIDAVAAFYDDSEERDHAERADAFRDGWERAYRAAPEDVEAASFYALAILSTIPPTTDNVDKQRQAGAILEDVLEQVPQHPGGHHYLIHAYDNPELAQRAVPVARSYAEIAPSVPHTLHMPSHIFTRLGMWDESIEWNARSADAAAQNPLDGTDTLHLYHALDYLTYAYLQEARDERAEQIAERARRADTPQQHAAVAYASVAIPARIALEQRDWAAAIDAEPLHPDKLDWDRWPYIEGINHATRAIGAIYLDNLSAARAELATVEELQEASVEMDEPYWAAQLAIYEDVTRALLADAEGDRLEAIASLRSATAAQDALGKHPITPGRVIQPREYLGELLRRSGQPEEALEVYETALEQTPGRFNAVYGAAAAAREAGQQEVAREHYEQLVELAAEADEGARPELEEARQFTASGGV